MGRISMIQAVSFQSIDKLGRVARKLLGAALIRRVSLISQNSPSPVTFFSLSERAMPTHIPREMTFLSDAQHLQKSTYTFPKIYTAALENIIYCSQYNTILLNPFCVLKDSISTVNIPRHRFDLAVHFRNTEPVSGICTVFRSFEERNFYHTLIDNLPRLFLLHHPDYQRIPEINLLYADPLKDVERHLLQSILPPNVKFYSVDRTRNYRIEKLIFPSFLTQDYAAYLPQEYLTLLDQTVAPQRPSRKNQRIFISRAVKPHKKTRSRFILNEDAVFELLAPYGFQRYYLENLSCAEQIELFYDCEYIVAAHGAGLSNLIFSPHATVLELFPTPYVVPYFYFLCESRSHQYHYWCGTETHRDSNFLVDLDAIQHILEHDMGIQPQKVHI